MDRELIRLRARQIWSCFRPGDVVRAKVVRCAQSCSSIDLLTDTFMSADLARRFAIMFVDLPRLPSCSIQKVDTLLPRRRFPFDSGQLARSIVCRLDQDGRATRGNQLGRDARSDDGRGRGAKSGRTGIGVPLLRAAAGICLRVCCSINAITACSMLRTLER